MILKLKRGKSIYGLLLIFLIILFIFAFIVFASTQLYYENFNSGVSSGWTSGGGGSWTVDSTQAYGGSGFSFRYYNYQGSPANVTRTSAISTVGYENITFSYQKRTAYLGSGEFLAIYWTDGTNEYELYNGKTGGNWEAGSHTLPAGASENSNFNIIFSCHHNGGYFDVCNIDEVTVTGVSNVPLIDYAAQTPTNGAFLNSDSIYINWTFIESNVSSIQVFLYNSTSLVNYTLFSSETNAINFTDLPDEDYIYYVTINDSYNNLNQTLNRTIGLDSNYPLVDYGSGIPGDAITTKSNSLFVNVSVIESNEANITFLLYDETSEVNKTTFIDLTRTINFTGLTDGTYSYNVTVTDSTNKKNTTAIRTLTIDTLAPPIDYDSETKINNTYINSDSIYINWTFIEASLSAIQVFLYDSNSLVNNTLFSTATNAINISSLPNEQYTYYVFINDSVDNYNETINRTITLDSVYPLIDYDSSTSSNGLNTSKNSIYVDVVVTETNEQNITFLLYNGTSEVNKTTFTDSSRNINFTNLPDDTYYYNITITDKVNQINYTETRHLTIDSTNPLISYDLETQSNNTYLNSDSIYINWSYIENNLNSIEIYLYNSTSLVNNTLYTSSTTSINFTNLPNNQYIYYVFINDSANNQNQTINRTITLDNTSPLIDYSSETPTNGLNTTTTSIFVNISVTETNEQNITFLLYNSTGEINKTTFTDSTRTINFTNLPDENYYYNVTITDKTNKINYTETRHLTIDTTNPLINYDSETKANNSYIDSDTIYINWSYIETNLNSIEIYLYNSTSLVNNTLYTSSTTSINFTNLPNNQYIYYVFINDSANNQNQTINRTITLDNTSPLIDYSSETPTNGLNTTTTSIFVNISVTETNEQNITFLLYNSTGEVNRTTFTDSTRNINFTNLQDENYYYNVTITDKTNKINYTETRHLTIDTTNPLINYDSETKANNSYIDSDTIYINWSYTETNLNTIQIFLYNTTSLVNNSLYTSATNAINITVNNEDEIYTYYVFINDSANNQNQTINRTITLDNTSPLIDYSSETSTNGLNTTTTSIFVNVSVTETNEQNTTFLLYNSTAQINISIFNDSTRTINFTNLPDDTYYYNITITDKTNKINYTETRHLTVDTTGPSIANISTDPNNLDDIDPSTFVNITANIDDGRLVSGVIMQYKRTGAYINKTMSNPSGNLYVSDFTTDVIEGVYYYRFVMNDSLGNTIVTDEYNVTSTYDFTWSVTPTILDEVSGNLEEEKSVGVITINNTGDGTLLFTLSNNWANLVEYNVSNPFYLSAKAKESINLTTTLASTDSRLDMAVTITASHATETPSPLVRTSNVTIISSAGGPVMSLELVTTPSTAVEQGQTINGRAKLRNIGNETAPNATLVWGFANSFWQNISGNKTELFTNFAASDISYSNITINVTHNVSAGVYIIPINVSCFKSNGSRCSSNAETSLTFAVAVSCSNTDGVCGAGCSYLTDSDCDEPENTTLEVTNTVTTGGSSGGSSSTGGSKKVEKGNIVSGEIIEVVRGRGISFNLLLKNSYKGVMKDITIDVSGFLSQYIELEEIPKSIKPGKTFDVKVNILAPEYLSRQDFDLRFVIKAIVEETKEGDVMSRLNFQEIRNIVLAVHELSKDDAIELLNLTEIEINKIKALNLSATKLEKKLQLSFKDLDKREYESIQNTYELIQSTVETALDVNSRIEDLKLNIKDAQNQGLNTPNTERLMNLAFFALSREDYTTASERIKEAEFTFNIETKGKFSIIYYVKNNPLQSSLWIIFGLFLTSGSIFSIRYSRIRSELKKLGKEKVILNNLIKTAQKECFEENMISVEEYQTSLKQYENRLSAIAQREIELIALKSALFNPRLKRNEFERKKLLDLIKQAQDEYIIQGKQETRSYRDKIKNYFSRLSEIENKLAFKESQKAIKKEKHKRLWDKFKIKRSKKRFYKPKKRR